MTLPDGRCFACALGQCKRCDGPPCNHDCPPNRRWDGDPRADSPPRRSR